MSEKSRVPKGWWWLTALALSLGLWAVIYQVFQTAIKAFG